MKDIIKLPPKSSKRGTLRLHKLTTSFYLMPEHSKVLYLLPYPPEKGWE